MDIKYLIISFFAAVCPNVVWAQNENARKDCPFWFEASYVGEVAANFSGGIKKGATYLGLANMKAAYDTDMAGWWRGGKLFVNIGNTHGGEPTARLVGDFQGVSNIEAGNLTFMYELWYKQMVGKVDVTFGLQDLNADFAVSENGALFSNGSFGIHSCIADNVSSAIFPLTALGANIHWNISNDLLWQAALFDGTPDDFESNPYNLGWKLNKNQGYLAFTEFQVNKSPIRDKAGSYKFGVYYHEHADTLSTERRNGGVYFVGDQQITEKLGVFSQIALSPKNLNKNNRYLSLGFNYAGLLKKRPNDRFGIAIAYAGMSDREIGSETVLEMTYVYKLNKYISIRPDVQYVVNPAGTRLNPDNALVGFLRFEVNY